MWPSYERKCLSKSLEQNEDIDMNIIGNSEEEFYGQGQCKR